MSKHVALSIIIIVVAIASFMALVSSRPEKVVIQKPEKVWHVHTIPVSFQDISPEIKIYGRVETPRKATLKAAMAADVLQADVLEGSMVKTEQTLVILDNTDVQIALTQKQAELLEINAQIDSERLRVKRDNNLLEHERQLFKLAENAVARAKKLEKSKLASQANLDEALADKQRQALTVKRLEFDIEEHPARLAVLKAKQKRYQALLQQAKVDLDRTVVKAPFDGRVAALNVALGDRVGVGDSLLILYDLSNLEVRAQIPGRYVNSVRSQLELGIRPSATAVMDGKLLTFELVRLSGEVRKDSGGIDGLFRLTKSIDALALGTFVELKLQLMPQSNVVVIPMNSLYELNRVYRLNDGYLEAVNIDRVGEYHNASGEHQLLIRSDELVATDQIVSTQLPNAVTGLRVESVQ